MTVTWKTPPPDAHSQYQGWRRLSSRRCSCRSCSAVIHARDDGAAPRVAVVNQAFVHTHLAMPDWPPYRHWARGN
jgi:hypothetical protein